MTQPDSGRRGFSPAGLRFHTILANVEAELQIVLSKARAESGHGGTIGDGAEAAVRKAGRAVGGSRLVSDTTLMCG